MVIPYYCEDYPERWNDEDHKDTEKKESFNRKQDRTRNNIIKRELNEKCSTEDIRKRFDMDVERFSNLDTGQKTTIDAPLTMELITEAACNVTSKINRILDIGCGAGNNTIKLLQTLPSVDCDLLDLSAPMLKKAEERVRLATSGTVRTIQSDIRNALLDNNTYDVILAAAVLHHLRDDLDWETVFRKLYNILKFGGSLWITDIVSHNNTTIQEMMWDRYGNYLIEIGGCEYRDKVFDYIDFEDSPRPVTYQLELLKKVGFRQVELLHKNSCFAAFGAIK